MISIDRPPRPRFLNRWKEWGFEFDEAKKKNPDYKFNWKSIDGERINKPIRRSLKSISGGRCMYCDQYVELTSFATIDHFKPKENHPYLVYFWGNLFLACNFCNQYDNSGFDKDILKPDRDEYSFEKYFIYDFISGKILPNPKASDQEKARATKTIEYFHLNEGERTSARREHYKTIIKHPDPKDLEMLSYRFIFDQEIIDAVLN